jgi:hypothetical protein
MGPRFDHNASILAIHEAGHAVERYLLHGTTGAIRAEPSRGKEAAAEIGRFPDSLLTNNGATLKGPPYDANQTDFLEKAIKTTFAGFVAEGLMRGVEPSLVLGEHEQESDDRQVVNLAKCLWGDAYVKRGQARHRGGL